MDLRSDAAEPVRQWMVGEVERFTAKGCDTRSAERMLRAREWGLAFEGVFFLNRRMPGAIDPEQYREMEDAVSDVIGIFRLEATAERHGL